MVRVGQCYLSIVYFANSRFWNGRLRPVGSGSVRNDILLEGIAIACALKHIDISLPFGSEEQLWKTNRGGQGRVT